MYDLADRIIADDEPVSEHQRDRDQAKPSRIALISSFTPRRCGIATFTADIYASLIAASPRMSIDIYALTSAAEDVSAAPEVCATILDDDRESYRAAAYKIDASDVDAVWLQHEFGLFGGFAGDMVLDLVDRIAAPLIITFHTVLPDPDDMQMRVMRRLIGRASKLVVMSESAGALLRSVYDADKSQIVIIPHGVPQRPFGRGPKFRAKFGFKNLDVLMTFGLLSPGKGIEAAIAALPAIIADHPQVLYCIVGATHPNLVAREGEAYRERLKALAASLGVERHIHWIDAFVETSELLDLIEAADIYITPYPGANQSTSGTLAYAVALGKAVISTPYVHARELLANNHGILVPFNDSAAIAREANMLLDHPDRLLALQTRAYARGQEMAWPVFAKRSLDVIKSATLPVLAIPPLKPIGVFGLLRICDDTGIFQHSIFNVPDRAHGYCVDDNARALMLMNRIGTHPALDIPRLTAVFASFVQSTWNVDTREFRNFMDHRRHWLEDRGSEDSCGRTLWALGATALEGRSAGVKNWAYNLFDETATSAINYGSPRATAFAMLGADYILSTDPSHATAQTILSEGAERLCALLMASRRPDWSWFEIVLAYDNCRLPEALIRAGMRLQRAVYTACGLETLKWIMKMQTAPAGHLRPIGSDSFGHANARPLPFDQQPVEIWAAVDASRAAYDLTGNAIWLVQARQAYAWFSGTNDRGVAIGDPVTGTCYDGLNPRGVNLNEGAESVLAYQLATYAMLSLRAAAA